MERPRPGSRSSVPPGRRYTAASVHAAFTGGAAGSADVEVRGRRRRGHRSFADLLDMLNALDAFGRWVVVRQGHALGWSTERAKRLTCRAWRHTLSSIASVSDSERPTCKASSTTRTISC